MGSLQEFQCVLKTTLMSDRVDYSGPVWDKLLRVFIDRVIRQVHEHILKVVVRNLIIVLGR